MGGFLAGGFGPLTFLWLVLGYFQQQDELQQNTKARRQLSDELEKSIKQQTALAVSSNRQAKEIAETLKLAGQAR